MKILMSIKPEYANKIFRGKKTDEFRKVVWKAEGVESVVVYASAPISMVIGEFEISYLHHDTIHALWHKSWYPGISPNDFMKYWGEKVIGYAIGIGSLMLYEKPKPLSDYNIKRPPQNFMYLKGL
jgi:predicted transcriptional regulator